MVVKDRIRIVVCIKDFVLRIFKFVKYRLYKFCFDDSTVYHPLYHYWAFIGLDYSNYFKKIF